MNPLLVFRPRPTARERLIAVPWAGASAAGLRPLVDALHAQGADLEVHAVTCAGRGHRRSLPAARSLDEVVDDLLPSVVDVARRGPFSLYGHSVGAIVAFGLTIALERQGLSPRRLFAAARAAPSIDLSSGNSGSLDDDSLLALLTSYGLIDPALFSHSDVRAALLPALRSDLMVSETARLHDVVTAPITAIRGRDDAAISPADISAWQRHTRGAFHERVIDGGHLFVRDLPAETARLLLESP